MIASSAHDHLVALMQATPPPPAANADPADVLDSARRMVENRRGPYDSLRSELKNDRNAISAHRESAQLLERLQQRDAGWAAALTLAHSTLRRRIASVGAAQAHKRQGASYASR